MIEGPLAWLLTALFALTAGYCAWRWVRRDAAATTAAGLGRRAVDANHAMMSVAMVVMVWWPSGRVGLWAQAAVFALLAVVLAVLVGRLSGVAARVGAISHVVLNGAMIWMLVAMPVLMGPMLMGSGTSGGGAHAHHHGGTEMAAMASPAPGWVQAVNSGMVAASVLVGAWWVGRAVASTGHRLHCGCHALMAAGMAAMLAAM